MRDRRVVFRRLTHFFVLPGIKLLMLLNSRKLHFFGHWLCIIQRLLRDHDNDEFTRCDSSMKNETTILFCTLVSLCTAVAFGADESITKDRKKVQHEAGAAFEKASTENWQEVFFDTGTANWQERWFLDGEIGKVKTGANGMELTAGPEFKNDAHHMVLWTRDRFAGDLKIEYEYTRLDAETRCVNILYIQATGSGKGPFERDISKWNELRREPAMRMYYDHMHAYHISYAAFPNNKDTTGYIRARRYLPDTSGLKGTALKPDYYPEGLFKPGVPHKITFIKKARDLFIRIENAEQTYHCHMANPDLPPIEDGRVGLRHMFTRSARYKNFRISTVSRD